MASMIEVKDVTKLFGQQGAVCRALHEVNFEIDPGAFVAVMGPSGSGKTALLNIISTIDKPTKGRVIIDGRELNALKEKELALFRRDMIGFVFQEFNLLDNMTIRDNIALPLTLNNKKTEEILRKVRELTALFGIDDQLDKYPYQLSGGQKQRAAVCRALVNDPKILFADEPTGALDSKAASELLACFQNVRNKYQTTVVMVTHDASAASYCDRVLFLKDGIATVRLVFVLMLVLMFALTGCSNIPSTKPYLAEDRDSRWVNDITYLEKTLPQVHKNLFFHLSEEEFHRQLEELKNKIPDYTDGQIEIELSVILAGIGDTHTGSSIGAEYRYPLEFHWFAEGIYVTRTNKEDVELLDARIITLNGKKIEEAANKLRPVLGEANESWFKTQIIYYLPIPGVLQYFGLSTSDEIELGVKLANGEEKKVKLKPISYKEYVAAERPAMPVPLYRSHPDENYWYEYLEEEKTVYLNYNSCRQMRDKPFEIFAKEFWDFVESHEVEKLVLDIRNNRGGSSPILEPFIKEVKNSSFNQPGRLYVIIGRDTFSSAILNAIRLKKETKAYFVGEATGGEPNHYGEAKQFKLPNSEKPIRYSTKYFQWVDENINTLEPDKVIEETFAAYREGTDPVLEWIGKN